MESAKMSHVWMGLKIDVKCSLYFFANYHFWVQITTDQLLDTHALYLFSVDKNHKSWFKYFKLLKILNFGKQQRKLLKTALENFKYTLYQNFSYQLQSTLA